MNHFVGKPLRHWRSSVNRRKEDKHLDYENILKELKKIGNEETSTRRQPNRDIAVEELRDRLPNNANEIRKGLLGSRNTFKASLNDNTIFDEIMKKKAALLEAYPEKLRALNENYEQELRELDENYGEGSSGGRKSRKVKKSKRKHTKKSKTKKRRSNRKKSKTRKKLSMGGRHQETFLGSLGRRWGWVQTLGKNRKEHVINKISKLFQKLFNGRVPTGSESDVKDIRNLKQEINKFLYDILEKTCFTEKGFTGETCAKETKDTIFYLKMNFKTYGKQIRYYNIYNRQEINNINKILEIGEKYQSEESEILPKKIPPVPAATYERFEQVSDDYILGDEQQDPIVPGFIHYN